MDKLANFKRLLEIAYKAYEMEKKREDTLNTKASAFLAAGIAYLTAVSGKISVVEVMGYLCSKGLCERIAAFCLLTLLILSLWFVLSGMYSNYGANKVAMYSAIDLSNLKQDAVVRQTSENYFVTLISHIEDIVKKTRLRNDEKAGMIDGGMRNSAIGAVGLFIYIFVQEIMH